MTVLMMLMNIRSSAARMLLIWQGKCSMLLPGSGCMRKKRIFRGRNVWRNICGCMVPVYGMFQEKGTKVDFINKAVMDNPSLYLHQ